MHCNSVNISDVYQNERFGEQNIKNLSGGYTGPLGGRATDPFPAPSPHIFGASWNSLRVPGSAVTNLANC